MKETIFWHCGIVQFNFKWTGTNLNVSNFMRTYKYIMFKFRKYWSRRKCNLHYFDMVRKTLEEVSRLPHSVFFHLYIMLYCTLFILYSLSSPFRPSLQLKTFMYFIYGAWYVNITTVSGIGRGNMCHCNHRLAELMKMRFREHLHIKLWIEE
jgi:hypothetical protein